MLSATDAFPDGNSMMYNRTRLHITDTAYERMQSHRAHLTASELIGALYTIACIPGKVYGFAEVFLSVAQFALELDAGGETGENSETRTLELE